MSGEKHSRQVAFFGKEGQEKLQRTHAVVIGVGGIGSHVVQQLAFLGVGTLTVIDYDPLEETNLNRLIGVKDDDPIGMPKVEIAERNIKSIDSGIEVVPIQDSFITEEGFAAIRQATYVFGCVDNDGARLVLNEFCLAYEQLYTDIASDIEPAYGGRVITILDDTGCLYCLDQIDAEQAGKDLESPEARKDREAIYGVPKEVLGTTGPSVVSINGVVASLGVTEFMLHVTGIREAKGYQVYHGARGIINTRDLPNIESCYYCKRVRGKGDAANLSSYLPK